MNSLLKDSKVKLNFNNALLKVDRVQMIKLCIKLEHVKVNLLEDKLLKKIFVKKSRNYMRKRTSNIRNQKTRII